MKLGSRLNRTLRLCMVVSAFALAAPHALADRAGFDSLEPLFDRQATEPASGAPALLQFWASWCHSCSGIMWDMDAIMEGSEHLTYVAISLDDDPDEARAYIKKHALFSKYRARYFHDPGKRFADTLEVSTVPAIVVIDASGSVVLRRAGHLNSSDFQALNQAIKSLAATSGHSPSARAGDPMLLASGETTNENISGETHD